MEPSNKQPGLDEAIRLLEELQRELADKANPYSSHTPAIYHPSPVNIVEIGGIRLLGPDGLSGDGHSTLRWIQYLQTHEGGLTVVDPDPIVKENTEKLLRFYHPQPDVHIIRASGEIYLSMLSGPIHLLYLDGPDVGSDGYQEAHHHMFAAATPFMVKGGLVVVDDANYPDYGKAGLIHFAIKDDPTWDFRRVGDHVILRRLV